MVVLIHAPLPVGFGPSQRAVQIAEMLREHGHQARIFSDNIAGGAPSLWRRATPVGLVRGIFSADVCLASPAIPLWAITLLRLRGAKLVTDYYCPDFIEIYERFRNDTRLVARLRYEIMRRKLQFLLHLSDQVIASSRELQLFLKAVSFGAGILTPRAYAEDKTFSRRHVLGPYGWSRGAHRDAAEIAQKYFPSIDFGKPVFVWGGGIWSWFDPVTVVRAFKIFIEERKGNALLVFPAIRIPRASSIVMGKSTELMEEIQQANLPGHIHVNRNWIPYEDCLTMFTLCRAGLCIATPTIETEVAFRTRIVDYIGSELPVISSAGDPLSTFVANNGLGVAVPPQEIGALVNALQKMTQDQAFYDRCKQNLHRVAPRLEWRTTLEPVVESITMKSDRKAVNWFAATSLGGGYSLLRLLFWVADYRRIGDRLSNLRSKLTGRCA